MSDTQHVFQILQQDGVSVVCHRTVIEPGDGVIKQLQRTVGDGEIGGLFLHPGFQILIRHGEVFRHVVEGLAQPAQFVVASVLGAYRKIAAPQVGGK